MCLRKNVFPTTRSEISFFFSKKKIRRPAGTPIHTYWNNQFYKRDQRVKQVRHTSSGKETKQSSHFHVILSQIKTVIAHLNRLNKQNRLSRIARFYQNKNDSVSSKIDRSAKVDCAQAVPLLCDINRVFGQRKKLLKCHPAVVVVKTAITSLCEFAGRPPWKQ